MNWTKDLSQAFRVIAAGKGSSPVLFAPVFALALTLALAEGPGLASAQAGETGEAEEAASVPLFDGVSLKGWKAVGSAVWRAEDGILVGGQDGDPKRSGLLHTEKTFQDFDLELDFMLDEHGKYNSGVYLRNRPGEERRTGYQINLGRGVADEPVGLYLRDWLDRGDAEDRVRKPRAWNHLRIRAVGAHIDVWLNGTKIVDYTDPAPEDVLLAPGTIAFQTYGAEGHAGWVKFRDIRIRDLGGFKDEAAKGSAGE